MKKRLNLPEGGIPAIPIIRQVIMEYKGLRYQAMPPKGRKDLYPGDWKCGMRLSAKCVRLSFETFDITIHTWGHGLMRRFLDTAMSRCRRRYAL